MRKNKLWQLLVCGTLGLFLTAPSQAHLPWDSFVAVKSGENESARYGSGMVFARQDCLNEDFHGKKCLVILTADHVGGGETSLAVLGHGPNSVQLTESWREARRLAVLSHQELMSIEIPEEVFTQENWHWQEPPQEFGDLPLAHCYSDTETPRDNIWEQVVGYGYVPGETRPWFLSEETLGQTLDREIKIAGLEVLPYLDRAIHHGGLVVHRGTSGAWIWGCSSKTQKPGPVGMVSRGDLSTQQGWLIPWEQVLEKKTQLLSIYTDSEDPAYEWKIEWKDGRRVYVHRATDLRVSDLYPGNADVSGREGGDSGGAENTVPSSAFSQASKDMRKAIMNLKDSIELVLFDKTESSFLKRPEPYPYGAVIEQNHRSREVYRFENESILGAANLLHRASLKPEKIAAFLEKEQGAKH